MSRIEPLKALLDQDPRNSRFRFMLAMEYKSAGDYETAVAELDRLNADDPDYVSGYFQAGQMSEERGNTEAARAYYTKGVEAARRTGDAHALSEIQGALDLLG